MKPYVKPYVKASSKDEFNGIPSPKLVGQPIQSPKNESVYQRNVFGDSLDCQGIHKKIDRCLSDITISTAVDTRISALKCSKWQMTSGLSDNDHELVFQLIKDVIPYLLEHTYRGRLYGKQVVQIMWKEGYVNGRRSIKPSKLMVMPHNSYSVDIDGNFYEKTSYNKRNLVDGEDLMLYVYAVNSQDWKNVEGRALGDQLYWPWYHKKALEKISKDHCNNTAYPFIHVTYKPCSDETDLDFEDSVKSAMQKNCRAYVTPEGVKFEGISVASASNTVQECIKTACTDLTKYILGQTLTTESSQTGSEALGRVHNEVRKEKIKSDFEFFAIMARQLALRTMIFNGIQGDCPDFNLVESRDIKRDLAERDEILSRMNVNFEEGYFRKHYGLDEGDISIQDPAESQFGSKLASRADVDNDRFEKKAIKDSTDFGDIDSLLSSIDGAQNTNQLMKVLADYQEEVDEAAMEGLELAAAAPYLSGANNLD